MILVIGSDEIVEILQGNVGVASLRRDLVRVTGEDGANFLQGQITQDINSIEQRVSKTTYVLEPDGKVCVYGRISRLADGWLFDCEPGFGELLLSRLKRYCIRVDVELTCTQDIFVALRSWDSSLLDAIVNNRTYSAIFDRTLGTIRGALRSVDFLGEEGDGFHEVDILGEEGDGCHDALVLAKSDLEFLRILSGEIRFGCEITQGSLPQELREIESAVAFGKGCYTGQELVERVASREARPPKRVHWSRFKPAKNIISEALADYGDLSMISQPVEVLSKSKVVGRLSSLAISEEFAFASMAINRSVGDGDLLGFTFLNCEFTSY